MSYIKPGEQSLRLIWSHRKGDRMLNYQIISFCQWQAWSEYLPLDIWFSHRGPDNHYGCTGSAWLCRAFAELGAWLSGRCGLMGWLSQASYTIQSPGLTALLTRSIQTLSGIGSVSLPQTWSHWTLLWGGRRSMRKLMLACIGIRVYMTLLLFHVLLSVTIPDVVCTAGNEDGSILNKLEGSHA